VHLCGALPSHRIDVVSDVWEEVVIHAPDALQDSRLYRVTSPIQVPQNISQWNLDRGEQAALSYALAQRSEQDVLVLCDERQARQACTTLSLPVVGSIGLIVEAFRAGRASLAIASETLRNLPHTGRLHIRTQLIEQAVAELERSYLRE
jgi:predicted nucleic acid-binding protein